jgi:uncharacterized DUF497 family protein
MSLAFEWDNRKARTNLEKHRVSFVEAVSVFNDPLARIFADEDHIIGEPRDRHRPIVVKEAFSNMFRGAGEGTRSHYQRPARHEKRATRL